MLAEAVRQQALIVSELPIDKQHEVLVRQLDSLHQSGLLSTEEASALRNKAQGTRESGAVLPLATASMSPLPLAQLLDATIPAGILAPTSGVTPESALGTLIDGICTAAGAILGGAIGGPVGAGFGASIGHAVGTYVGSRLPQ